MSASTFQIERALPATHHTPHGATGTTGTTPNAVLHQPSLTTTVPKEYVHRASVAEVMLTGWHRRDEHRFTVSAQWPRLHGFFATVDGHHDPLLVAETIRQAGLLLAHTEFAVPLGHQFLMWDLSVDTRPEHLLITSTPAAPEIEVTCTDIKRRGTTISGLHLDVVIRRDGHTAATGAASFNCTSPAVYQRLRAARIGHSAPAPLPLTSPLAPQDVGRLSPTDVVLSPTPQPDHWQLRADTRHPVLFDHPVDHIPGMVLLEAARQATTAHLGQPCLPTAIHSHFTRYAELDTPCLITARTLTHNPTQPPQVHITGHQDNTPIFTTTITTT
ncbi:ScbA/BarX family gamma-butyrolactone biosynthesis protein [Streptomyces longwoodensis]|uniref:ScbA/BarX family gamma-butyrolactone biosynthesis protein n=1 Tax=Streptomyces longwoodensis TaxID=68231 RepID=UPI0036E99C0C